MMASKIHDGTASSFLDAMIKLGDNPDIESVNAILSSFGDLNHQEQDTVLRSPTVSSRLLTQEVEQVLKMSVLGFAWKVGYGRGS